MTNDKFCSRGCWFRFPDNTVFSSIHFATSIEYVRTVLIILNTNGIRSEIHFVGRSGCNLIELRFKTVVLIFKNDIRFIVRVNSNVVYAVGDNRQSSHGKLRPGRGGGLCINEIIKNSI